MLPDLITVAKNVKIVMINVKPVAKMPKPVLNVPKTEKEPQIVTVHQKLMKRKDKSNVKNVLTLVPLVLLKMSVSNVTLPDKTNHQNVHVQKVIMKTRLKNVSNVMLNVKNVTKKDVLLVVQTEVLTQNVPVKMDTMRPKMINVKNVTINVKLVKRNPTTVEPVKKEETHHQPVQSYHQLPNQSRLKTFQSDLLKLSIVDINVPVVLNLLTTVLLVVITEKVNQNVIALKLSMKTTKKPVLNVKTNVNIVFPKPTVPNVPETDRKNHLVIVQLKPMTLMKLPVHLVETYVKPVKDLPTAVPPVKPVEFYLVTPVSAQMDNMKTKKTKNVKDVTINVKNVPVMLTNVTYVPKTERKIYQIVHVHPAIMMTENPLNVKNVLMNVKNVTNTDVLNAVETEN